MRPPLVGDMRRQPVRCPEPFQWRFPITKIGSRATANVPLALRPIRPTNAVAGEPGGGFVRSLFRRTKQGTTEVADLRERGWSRRKLRLTVAGAGACVAGGVLALVSSGLGYAQGQVTITSATGAGCLVNVSPCSY